MIDWTQPIETTETPPRPVRVLFDKDGRPEAAHIDDNHASPSFNLFALERIGAGVNATRGMYSIPLRNVAPPKPEPVRYERCVALTDNGGFLSAWETEEQCREYSKGIANVVKYRRIAWMSDGSPVPGEDDPLRYGVCETCVEKSVKRCDELVAERDSLKAEVVRLRKANPPLVCTYQSTPKKTAAEAVANVAEMMGPVKSCTTCRFHCNVAIESCTENEHRGWEAKSEPAMMGPVQHRGCSTCHFGVSGDCLSTNTAECNAPKFPYWEAKND
jgi:hypothetical protein